MLHSSRPFDKLLLKWYVNQKTLYKMAVHFTGKLVSQTNPEKMNPDHEIKWIHNSQWIMQFVQHYFGWKRDHNLSCVSCRHKSFASWQSVTSRPCYVAICDHRNLWRCRNLWLKVSQFVTGVAICDGKCRNLWQRQNVQFNGIYSINFDEYVVLPSYIWYETYFSHLSLHGVSNIN